MTSDTAIDVLMQHKGKVIIGLRPGAATIKTGKILSTFGNNPLWAHQLRVVGPATPEDWAAQVETLGFSDPGHAEPGRKFYAAITVVAK